MANLEQLRYNEENLVETPIRMFCLWQNLNNCVIIMHDYVNEGGGSVPRRIIVLVMGLMLVFSSLCLAEDMRFVDSNGTTGYYVDADTVVIGPDGAHPNISQATVAVVKARANRRYLYQMQFDRGLYTYQIFYTTVQAYDTKKVLEARPVQEGPQAYGASSPMSAVVAFIYELQAERARKAAKSY